MMKISKILSLLLACFSPAVCTDNGLTTAVTWDQYSLTVNGTRVFVQSGEFHYARLPVPALWRDVLEKFKANGLNTISVYFFWSYHSARKGEFDFTSPGKDIQHLFDIAKEVGLWVIARPGPYCNAETNGGGLALYGSDGSFGTLRASDETYFGSWKPWIEAVGAIIAKNQITNGGPVILYQIENELQETRHDANDTLVLYMEQIKQVSRDIGIVVPFISNEKGMRSQSWSTDYQDVGGSVNIYGLDSYPGGFSCTNPDSGFNLVRTYYQWFSNYSYTQPSFLPEFEAGGFQPWGGSNYNDCFAEHSPEFADEYYKNNICQRVTMQNLYMAFGGTNWGNLAAPVVYTSYDYSALLSETRDVTIKFKQTKLINLFTRVSQDLLTTVMDSNGTGNAVSSEAIWSWVLRNEDTRAGFYVLQHNISSSREVTTFDVKLKTSVGDVTATCVQLNGRQSKIVTTDYHFGKNRTMLYSTADVLTWATFADETILVLYTSIGQTSEFAFAGNVSYQTHGSAYNVTATTLDSGEYTRVSYTKFRYTQTEGLIVVSFSDGLQIWLLDTATSWDFYATPLSANPLVDVSEQVFVLGPYNVRNATISSSTLTLVGDNENTTSIEVYAGESITSLIWNENLIETSRTAYGTLKGVAPGATEDQTPSPIRLYFKAADSLPERLQDYDDSKWVVCNKTSTLSPVAPLTLPVLFSSDYGYYAGIKIYRGYFDGTTATSANITMQGGDAAGFSAWVNGVFVGYNPGNASAGPVSALLDFSNATLEDSGNVLAVLTDYTGHDQTSRRPAGLENPRGILGAWLYGSNGTQLDFTQWKIQGNAGGDANIDPVRGPMNEDGLYGTRLGWHLPGFDASGSNSTNVSFRDAQQSEAGVRWYTATFEGGVKGGTDFGVGLRLAMPEGTVASVVIYINGYQFGKFLPHIGPQTYFPFPPGIYNSRATNTLSIAVWAMTDAGAQFTDASLITSTLYATSFNFSEDDPGKLQPGWEESRLQYA